MLKNAGLMLLGSVDLPLSAEEINRSLITFNKKIFDIEMISTYTSDREIFDRRFSNIAGILDSDSFNNLYKNLFDRTNGIIKKCFGKIKTYNEATPESKKAIQSLQQQIDMIIKDEVR